MDFIKHEYLNNELITEIGQCILCLEEEIVLYPQHCKNCLYNMYDFCECCNNYVRKDNIKGHYKILEKLYFSE